MTENQRIKLMSTWWPNACRAQGWPVNDRVFRVAKLSEIVNRQLASANDLNSREDIDAVRAFLLACVDNVKAAGEVVDPTIGEARRLRHVIRAQILPCLQLYEDAQSYCQTVISGLVRWNKTDRPTRPPTLDDLDAFHPIRATRKSSELLERASQLEQAVMTLNARLHKKRKAAGHSLHEMRTAARVPCHCRQCEPNVQIAIAMRVPTDEEIAANCPF